jgi:hypothetical protein
VVGVPTLVQKGEDAGPHAGVMFNGKHLCPPSRLCRFESGHLLALVAQSGEHRVANAEVAGS